MSDSELADCIESLRINDTGDVVKLIQEYLDKYKDNENLEMEYRLGFIDEQEEEMKFDSFVGFDFFEKVKKKLQTNQMWKSVESVKCKRFSNMLENNRSSIGFFTLVIKYFNNGSIIR